MKKQNAIKKNCTMFCMVHNIKKINIFVRINNFNSISVKQIQHTMISLGFVDNNEKRE